MSSLSGQSSASASTSFGESANTRAVASRAESPQRQHHPRPPRTASSSPSSLHKNSSPLKKNRTAVTPRVDEASEEVLDLADAEKQRFDDKDEDDASFDEAKLGGRQMLTFADLKGRDGVIGKDGRGIIHGIDDRGGTGSHSLFSLPTETALAVAEPSALMVATSPTSVDDPLVLAARKVKRDTYSTEAAYQIALRRCAKFVHLKSNKDETRAVLETSQRVKDLVEAYAVDALTTDLAVTTDKAHKLQRRLEDLITTELGQYCEEVRHDEMARNDSEIMGTRSSVKSVNLDLKDLRAERLLMQRLGFVEHVDALDVKIKALQEANLKRAEEKRAAHIERRMRLLRAQHARRLETFQDELAATYHELVADCSEKEAKVAESHARERDEFVERTMRMATCPDVNATACSCPNQYVCTHNKTASYRLRKRNPLTVKYASAARKLRKNRRYTEALEFQEKADAIENLDKARWAESVQNRALNTKLPVLVQRQERQATAVLETNALMLQKHLRAGEVAVMRLERVLECEAAKAEMKMRKLKLADFEDEEDKDSDQVIRSGRHEAPPTLKVEPARGAMSESLKQTLKGVASARKAKRNEQLLEKMNLGHDGAADPADVKRGFNLSAGTATWKPPKFAGLGESTTLLDVDWKKTKTTTPDKKSSMNTIAPNLLAVSFANAGV